MKPREFFIGRAIVLGILIVIGLGVFAYKTYFVKPELVTPSGILDSTETTSESRPPTFVWKFEEDDSLNPDGNPQTNVILEVQYPNGVEMRRLAIDTTPGSCNELYDTELDSVPGSANIQCYYAGLGYVFKITKGESAYLVQRKEFEEGSPEYEPPVSEFKVVFEIPIN